MPDAILFALVIVALLALSGWLVGRLFRDTPGARALMRQAEPTIRIRLASGPVHVETATRGLTRALTECAPNRVFEISTGGGPTTCAGPLANVTLLEVDAVPTTRVTVTSANRNTDLPDAPTPALWSPWDCAIDDLPVAHPPSHNDWLSVAELLLMKLEHRVVPGLGRSTHTPQLRYLRTLAQLQGGSPGAIGKHGHAARTELAELTANWPPDRPGRPVGSPAGRRVRERAAIAALHAAVCLALPEPPPRAAPRLLEGLDALEDARAAMVQDAIHPEQQAMARGLKLLEIRLRTRLAEVTGDPLELIHAEDKARDLLTDSETVPAMDTPTPPALETDELASAIGRIALARHAMQTTEHKTRKVRSR